MRFTSLSKMKKLNPLVHLKNFYCKYGFYHEELISITKKGKQGAEEISTLMHSLRNNPPQHIGGIALACLDDFR